MSIKILNKFYPLIQIAEREPKYKNIDTVIITGGRNSFKSFHVSLLSSLFFYQYNWRILYTRYTWASAKDSVIEEVKEKINLLNIADWVNVNIDRVTKKEDAEKETDTTPAIVFKGIKTSSGNQTANLKSLKGFNCFILEEGEEHPSFTDWQKIKFSIRRLDLPNISIIILNPTVKTHWIYREFFQKKGVNAGYNGIKDNILYIHSIYTDHLEWVPQNIIREFEQMKAEQPEQYNHIVLGGFKEKADGVIFDNWTFGEFDESLQYIYGLDIGARDPDALVRVAIDEKKKKIYIDELIYESGLSDDDLYNRIIKLIKRKKDLIIADAAAKKTILTLAAKGLNIIKAKKGAGSILAGIKKMKDYQMILTERSINLADELNNYKWGNKLAEIPVDEFNHLIDAVRYTVILKGVLW